MTSVDERTIFAKLEVMKDIRLKTVQMEKIKFRIVREVENSDAEEKCIAEYRRELELLMQEKMSHVEELRQIHADINAMETVIKQAEENRSRSVGMANRFHEEYLPLKGEIDGMRREYLGLERLPELHEEEGTIISPEYVIIDTYLVVEFTKPLLAFSSVFSRFQQHANFYSSGKLSAPSASFTRPTPVLSNAAPGQHHNSLPSSETPHITPLNPTHGFLPPAPPQNTTGIRGMNANNKPSDQTPARLQQTPPSIGMHPTFRSDFNVSLRQQPPPMKSCLSCHQQIHRNAPICPLCKAKSRSRNPKKPKKKDH
ncbi:unnamed protein product [Diamesa hyperborea]